jgi:hypothetical protein
MILWEKGAAREISQAAVTFTPAKVEQALMLLKWAKEEGYAHEVKSSGPGNVFMLKLDYENITEVITAFGQKGLPGSAVKTIPSYILFVLRRDMSRDFRDTIQYIKGLEVLLEIFVIFQRFE